MEKKDRSLHLLWLNRPGEHMGRFNIKSAELCRADAHKYLLDFIPGLIMSEKRDLVSFIIRFDAINCLKYLLGRGEEIWRILIARDYAVQEKDTESNGNSLLRMSFLCTSFIMRNYPSLINPENEFKAIIELGLVDILEYYYYKEDRFIDDIGEFICDESTYEEFIKSLYGSRQYSVFGNKEEIEKIVQCFNKIKEHWEIEME